MINTEPVALQGQLEPRGRLVVEHFNRFGDKIGEYDFPNGIADVGKDLLLDCLFNDGTAPATGDWSIGLIDSSGYTALAAEDEMDDHTGWNEFGTYTESTRVAWGPGASSSQSVTNASPATFNINGSGTVKGVFVVDDNGKSGTSGTLYATALFAAEVPVSSGDQLKVTYTTSA